jgi:hypothetical protein
MNKLKKTELIAPFKPSMAIGDLSSAGMTNLGLSLQYVADIAFTIYKHWIKEKSK